MKLKICGMKYQDNIQAVAALQPDYLGFIFYETSARYFNSAIPNISKTIKKTGVFVNETLDVVHEKIKTYNLQAVQLHGEELPEYCERLRDTILSGGVEIIKVFSIKDDFKFDQLEPYETVCDFFLFDTKGKLPGGNGYTFNWDVLNKYPSTKPYFLSGGIGLEETEKLKSFYKSPASKYCYAIDVNSKFEIEPGLKDTEQLKQFINRIRKLNSSRH
ncbi:phosphoribosylanthranilate isomerase [Aestuariibaculum sediminum]|uniref:N-(5'-phosphoribosyl)anthranilate isomerase n=1 Tax=Aestuariibaculum sediminum TaxID=2770637 RepID=A0A8J6Q0J6_9FLAO|nr:phosphoribosylanthranilate isomerase [Aestuariibaculum sediminum]MBD0830591.1 phosphoribosylanthranilate isomerase [Aestuariibaculum sediminum]